LLIFMDIIGRWGEKIHEFYSIKTTADAMELKVYEVQLNTRLLKKI